MYLDYYGKAVLMKQDKAFNTFFMFIAVFVMLATAYCANIVALRQNISIKYQSQLSLYGSRLSDTVFATVKKTEEAIRGNRINSEYRFTINNIDANSIKNWNVIIDIPENIKVDSAKDVEYFYDSSNRTAVFTPVYYNLSIDSMDSIDFSVAFSGTEAFNPGRIEFVGYQLMYNIYTYVGRALNFFFFIWLIVFIGYLVTRMNLRSYQERQKNDVKLILQSMNTFISFIDAKDPYTRGHSRRVAMYAAEIAKRMKLSEDEVQNIYYAGLLHDAGKISVPDAVLNKPGKLTDEERKLIQNHTVAGGKMLKQLSSLRGVRETALYHHERFDGTGYPEGLKGDKIPLYARIVGVADAYDAMSSNRVYRRHLNKEDIIEEIQLGSGNQFDPDIVKYMVDMINDGYVNVVKMETAETDGESYDFAITESDIPGVYMGY